MSWQLLTFEPVDVTIGSDHRQLDDSGTSVDTELSPQAFAGAIRTQILSACGYNFAKPPRGQSTPELIELGTALGVSFRKEQDNPQVKADKFALRGPLQYLENRSGGVTTYWPTPRSIVRDEAGTYHALIPTGREDLLCDQGLQDCEILATESKTSSPVTLPCPLFDLVEYLGGGRPPSRPLNALHRTELRTGHERDEHGVPKDQALFGREARRFEDRIAVVGEPTRLAAGYAVLAQIDESWLPGLFQGVRLGGDGHGAMVAGRSAAEVERELAGLKQAVTAKIDAGAGLLLYLAAPSVFEDGWRPPFDLQQGVKLVAAALDPPQTISGWDIGRGRPKTPRRAVPAGAAYFYEVIDKSATLDKIVAPFHCQESVSSEHQELGFGLALCGCWNRGDIHINYG
jgi:CRISPR type III-B/RAMP module-associated protein Cmr3